MNTELSKLNEIMKSPTPFDSMRNYGGDIPEDEWLSVLVRTRDSGVLENCNFDVALERLGGESEDVQVFRFGHWACGWWECLAVKAGTEAETTGKEIASSLADYPVLDDEKFSIMEHEEACEVWKNCYRVSDRIDFIRKHRNEFEFRDYDDLIKNVRGEHYSGYADSVLS